MAEFDEPESHISGDKAMQIIELSIIAGSREHAHEDPAGGETMSIDVLFPGINQ